MTTDSSKRVWYNDIERDAFVETHCAGCFQVDEATKRVLGAGPGCPHLERAETGKTPKAWTRRRNAVMGDTYKCADELKKPPVNRRNTASTASETISMEFDVKSGEVEFVRIENWPSAEDFGKGKKSKGDHA